MKFTTLILIIICYSATYGQNIKKMHPTLGVLVDKSKQGELAYLKQIEECEKFWEKHRHSIDETKFTKTEIEIYEKCKVDFPDYWDIIGFRCSWYCGGGLDTNTASSELKSTKEISYNANNIHDLNYKTAWVEGVPGYGIGEYVEYHFPPENPRITEIIVVNGYVKSEQTWKDNSRVKKLKMYIDGKPFAILNLEDTRKEQIFHFDPIGNADRDDYEQLKNKPWWTIKFEILEVYKGDKFDDTAITEIYFDGIDVH